MMLTQVLLVDTNIPYVSLSSNGVEVGAVAKLGYLWWSLWETQWNGCERQYGLIFLSIEWSQSSRGAIYYMVVCDKELLAESERAVSVPQCHMGADSDSRDRMDNLGLL
jgi:hypothetical protein